MDTSAKSVKSIKSNKPNELTESTQTSLEQLNQALKEIQTNRIKSKELASVLNTNRHKVVAILRKLEKKKIVKQIKLGNKLASIWEIESTANITSKTNNLLEDTNLPSTPLVSVINKQAVTRQEFFQLLDQLYAELNEIKGQLTIANQSLEIIKTYWQRLYKLDTSRLGTAFSSTKNDLCT